MTHSGARYGMIPLEITKMRCLVIRAAAKFGGPYCLPSVQLEIAQNSRVRTKESEVFPPPAVPLKKKNLFITIISF